MGPVERGGRAQRYHRQSHAVLAFSLRKYYLRLTSHNIVHQADTFPPEKMWSYKNSCQKYKVQIEAKHFLVTDRSNFACLSRTSWDPDLTLKDFLYGREFFKIHWVQFVCVSKRRNWIPAHFINKRSYVVSTMIFFFFYCFTSSLGKVFTSRTILPDDE